VNGCVIIKSGQCFLFLVCAVEGDTKIKFELFARKIAKLRVLRDGQGKMAESIIDIGGEALVGSHLTFFSDLGCGNRPGFSRTAPSNVGCNRYKRFSTPQAEEEISLQTSKFGANMALGLVNDTPVAMWMASHDWNNATKGP